MHARTRSPTSLTVLAIILMATAAFSPIAHAAQPDDIHALDGEWIYVEDLTEGRALEMLGPRMSSTFSMRAEDDAVILVRGHGSGHLDVRVALDGSITEVPGSDKVARYRGSWKDGAFAYEVEFVRGSDTEPSGLSIHREFRVTADGLIVRAFGSSESVALYRHAEDIAMPAPAQAVIDDMAWLAGAWVGTRGSSSIEERWGPARGGAMLGTSQTVRGGAMSAFEFLRIVERDGGLVYVAQPGGNSPTEFVLSELGTTRAVFDNPRHDYPKRIAYELSADGGLTATIGFMKGGSPRRFEFTREGE